MILISLFSTYAANTAVIPFMLFISFLAAYFAFAVVPSVALISRHPAYAAYTAIIPFVVVEFQSSTAFAFTPFPLMTKYLT